MSDYGFGDNLEFWRRIRRGIPDGAQAAANAMARYLAGRTADDTLKRTSHGPGEYWKAAPGAPPAWVTGRLAGNMFWRPAFRGALATAEVGNRDPRAAMFEFGCHPVRPVRMKVMHWTDSGGSWYHAVLPADGSDFPAHPFLEPTVEEAVRDGSLEKTALDAFRDFDP